MEYLHLSARQRRRIVAELERAADVSSYRRLVALVALADGVPAAILARWLGASRQSLYNWVDRYTLEGGPAALRSRARPGRPPFWAEDATAVLRASLHQSPDELGYAAVNWTVELLRDHLGRCLGRGLSGATVRRQLHRLDYVWKRPRYVLKPDPQREKKTSAAPRAVATAPTERGALRG